MKRVWIVCVAFASLAISLSVSAEVAKAESPDPSTRLAATSPGSTGSDAVSPGQTKDSKGQGAPGVDGMDTIIVTAQRREQRLQDVPISQAT